VSPPKFCERLLNLSVRLPYPVLHLAHVLLIQRAPGACNIGVAGSGFAHRQAMLKFLGAYALAKLLGFGLITAILIYMLIR
jgi:hypothetical protein